ncbi:MAG: CbiX/SirB N-terminal domain-containing protein [Anaerolineales bacterium]|nr:CbiX/SirB N-terminal domain-containing protein [Anaerolineales bacterium]
MESNQTKNAVVLAAHGAPATDYPPMRVGFLMMLEFAKPAQRISFLRAWRDRLDKEIRTWRRTKENDPYKVAVDDLAAQLAARLSCRVIVGYNEFCTPTISAAIDQVIADGTRRVVVVTTMLVRGNSHTELEIQQTVVQARERHPTIDIRYAWPFESKRLISLFADQVDPFLE